MAKLGSGKRFSYLRNKIAAFYRKKGKSPEEARKIAAAIAAKQGIKKYGKKKMSSWARKQRRR